MTDYANKTVAELVTERPARARVFDNHKIDFCCGGKRPLQEACEKKSVPLDQVVSELAALDRKPAAPTADLTAMGPTALAQHIVATHHGFLKEELPRIERMVHKVAKVHGDKEPRLHEVLRVFAGLKEELLTHLGKEEQVLFPLVEQLFSGTLPAEQRALMDGPLNVMEMEHDSAGEALAELRRLTGDYAPPDWACNTFRALFDSLEALEHDTHQHIHKENNILFPQVRAEIQQVRTAAE
ncbi:MAG: iron-sulfur cluster repair di-iron protein [Candidatus Hydrogenedentota bacterium]